MAWRGAARYDVTCRGAAWRGVIIWVLLLFVKGRLNGAFVTRGGKRCTNILSRNVFLSVLCSVFLSLLGFNFLPLVVF